MRACSNAVRKAVILPGCSLRWYPGAAVSPFTNALATYWVEDGTADAMLEAIRIECGARQAIAQRYLAPYGMLGHPEAFHLWLPVPEGWTPVELA